MTPQALLEAFRTHNWMPLLIMVSVVIRTWLTDKSKFPLSLPVNWQPVVLATATGFVNAVAGLQAGESWNTVAMTTLAWAASTGFLDGVLVAVWGDPKKAPFWGRFIVMAFDDIEGAAPRGGAGAVRPPAPTSAESTPTLVTHVPSVPPKPVVNEHGALGGLLERVAILAVLGYAVFTCAVLFACGATTTNLPGDADIAQYWASQNKCVETATTREGADACRTADRAVWCAKFPASENCATDAGARE